MASIRRPRIRAEALDLGFRRTAFRLVWPGGTAAVESPLIGRYNVSNLLAALATCHALGREPGTILPRLVGSSVAGRIEHIEERASPSTSCMRTDDALCDALGMPQHPRPTCWSCS